MDRSFRTLRLAGTAAMAVGMLGACGAGTADARSAARSPAGLDVAPLTIASQGRTDRFSVEVARTPAQQERGLMFRAPLGPDRGMIFPYAAPQALSFWMKNTPSPLDIIFIGADGRIVNIAANAAPYSLAHIDSAGPAMAVLEIRGGRAAELGLRPGDIVKWRGAAK